MNNHKIHIDNYFHEKVKTQEVEGEIPSFDDFLLANPQSINVGSTTNYWIKSVIIVGSIVVVSVLIYCFLGNNPETLIENQKTEIEQKIDINSIQKEKTYINILGEEQQNSHKSAPKVSVQKKETSNIHSNDTAIENELILDIQKENVEELENPKDIEAPIIKKEELKGFDLYIEKNKSENEKGVKLYKK